MSADLTRYMLYILVNLMTTAGPLNQSLLKPSDVQNRREVALLYICSRLEVKLMEKPDWNFVMFLWKSLFNHKEFSTQNAT